MHTKLIQVDPSLMVLEPYEWYLYIKKEKYSDASCFLFTLKPAMS